MSLRSQVIHELQNIPEPRLKIIKDFIEYIKDKQSWRETREILGNTRMRTEIREAREAWRKGKHKKFKNFEKIK